jgi:hypothetical protein
MSPGWAEVVSSAITALAIASVWLYLEKKQSASFFSKRQWARPFFGITLAFGIVSTLMSLNEIDARNAQAFAESLRAKQTFPQQVDEMTWVDAIDTDGGKVIFSYSLAATDQEEASRIVDEMRKQLPSKVCSQPDMRRAVSEGVTLGFRYRMRNGPSYDAIMIASKDCSL